ncbi:hypothetical protein SADUNF_Sadunf16G0221600 [Salix dunnii]|uniref:Uncharacterized protein n=1 Tax=Salix dunnii TaxID=1413687 RepID=A0A835J845_9ROSI|nr:hypothetical protein SADUNF_Sadunf16G0221600 [Salix dunnii]
MERKTPLCKVISTITSSITALSTLVTSKSSLPSFFSFSENHLGPPMLPSHCPVPSSVSEAIIVDDSSGSPSSFLGNSCSESSWTSDASLTLSWLATVRSGLLSFPSPSLCEDPCSSFTIVSSMFWIVTPSSWRVTSSILSLKVSASVLEAIIVDDSSGSLGSIPGNSCSGSSWTSDASLTLSLLAIIWSGLLLFPSSSLSEDPCSSFFTVSSMFWMVTAFSLPVTSSILSLKMPPSILEAIIVDDSSGSPGLILDNSCSESSWTSDASLTLSLLAAIRSRMLSFPSSSLSKDPCSSFSTVSSMFWMVIASSWPVTSSILSIKVSCSVSEAIIVDDSSGSSWAFDASLTLSWLATVRSGLLSFPSPLCEDPCSSFSRVFSKFWMVTTSSWPVTSSILSLKMSPSISEAIIVDDSSGFPGSILGNSCSESSWTSNASITLSLLATVRSGLLSFPSSCLSEDPCSSFSTVSSMFWMVTASSWPVTSLILSLKVSRSVSEAIIVDDSLGSPGSILGNSCSESS